MSLSERESVTPAFTDASLSTARNKTVRKSTARSRLSVRINETERAYLENVAGDQSLSNYVRRQLLGDKTAVSKSRPKRRRRTPAVDQTTAAQLLAALGQSRPASNLNQIAKAAYMGALPVTPALEAELRAACRDISWMRRTLIEALGVKNQ